MELMPKFDSEEEFNAYFKPEREFCDRFRDENGLVNIPVADGQEFDDAFFSFLSNLFSITEQKEGSKILWTK